MEIIVGLVVIYVIYLPWDVELQLGKGVADRKFKEAINRNSNVSGRFE